MLWLYASKVHNKIMYTLHFDGDLYDFRISKHITIADPISTSALHTRSYSLLTLRTWEHIHESWEHIHVLRCRTHTPIAMSKSMSHIHYEIHGHIVSRIRIRLASGIPLHTNGWPEQASSTENDSDASKCRVICSGESCGHMEICCHYGSSITWHKLRK